MLKGSLPNTIILSTIAPTKLIISSTLYTNINTKYLKNKYKTNLNSLPACPSLLN